MKTPLASLTPEQRARKVNGGGPPSRSEALRTESRTLLAEIESELADTDRADDEFGKHAADARQKLDAEIDRHHKKPPETDDAESEYLWLHNQRRRAQRVEALADSERTKRGANKR